MGLAPGRYSSRKNRGTWLMTLNFMHYPERKPGQFEQLVQAALNYYRALCPSARIWAESGSENCEIKTTSGKLSLLASQHPFQFCHRCNGTGVESHAGELNHVCQECKSSKISPSSLMGQTLQKIGLVHREWTI